jgi:hypothetical protein
VVIDMQNAGCLNEKRRLLKKITLLMDEVESMIANGLVNVNDLVFIYDQLDEIYTFVLTFYKKGEGGEKYE